jgi:hypothetical protein
VLTHSGSLAGIAPALAKAQSEIDTASKGKVNPAFKSKYADLASVWDACRSALTKNGISVVQSPGDGEGGRVTMTTLLLHSSGEWIRGIVSAPVGKQDAQGVGSAVTYLRRYALAAMVSVAPDDDDGNAASGRDDRRDERPMHREPERQPPAVDQHDPSWEKGRAGFCAALGELGLKYEEVSAYFVAMEQGRPSSWPGTARRDLVNDLKSGAPILKQITDFIASTNPKGK